MHFRGSTLKKHLTYIVPFFFTLLFPISQCLSETGGTSQLTIQNFPDSTEFFLNGLSIQPDENGNVSVEPGPVLLEIKQRRVVVYSALFSIDSSEQKTISLDCTGDCALLHVTTEPTGATLSMNGEILGITPYLNRFLNPGSYSIMATYPGHIPIIRRIELTRNSSQIFSYKMEQTQAVKDSISAVKRAIRRKRQLIQGTLFGGAGVAMAAAGAYYDLKAYKYLQKAQDAADNYESARNNSDCQLYKNVYKSNRENAEKPILYRNILYSVAGACLAGFYLSFVF
jgi:hypothetical protein